MPNPGPTGTSRGLSYFNGDGKADILWQNSDGTPAIWLMNGTSIIGAGGLANPGPTGTPRGPATSTATARPTFFGRTVTARPRSGR